jgi:peptidoglycan/LPS O-acetylase OafA/YrhL
MIGQEAEATSPPPRTEAGGRRGGRLDRVDALRCFAMTAVILQHCRLLPIGWTGVWLFYVISGFVVTTSLIDSRRCGSTVEAIRGFFARRARRIIPIYAGVVALSFIGSAALTGRFEWGTFASYLFFFNNFAAPFGHVSFAGVNTGQLWTVSVEMQFYAVCGLGFFLLTRAQLSRLMIGLLFLSPLLRVLLSITLGRMDAGQAAYIIYSASPLHFDAFAAGTLLALHRQTLVTTKWVRRLAIAATLAILAYGGAYAAINVSALNAHGLNALRNILSGILFGEGRQVFVYSVVILAAVAVTAAAAAPGGFRLLNNLLDRSPLRWIGVRSYGAYVFHAAVLQAAHALLAVAGVQEGDGMSAHLRNGALLFLIAYPATIGLAALSFRYIETPILRSRRGRPAFRRAA